ncbi:hypothetical protein Ddc_15686 [Ditylenchus destructor]|nr:hypothetical protein Ddc_15686 [Ditylenchus destructor]
MQLEDLLSTDIWATVLGSLSRNELDRLEIVCRSFFQIIQKLGPNLALYERELRLNGPICSFESDCIHGDQYKRFIKDPNGHICQRSHILEEFPYPVPYFKPLKVWSTANPDHILYPENTFPQTFWHDYDYLWKPNNTSCKHYKAAMIDDGVRGTNLVALPLKQNLQFDVEYYCFQAYMCSSKKKNFAEYRDDHLTLNGSDFYNTNYATFRRLTKNQCYKSVRISGFPLNNHLLKCLFECVIESIIDHGIAKQVCVKRFVISDCSLLLPGAPEAFLALFQQPLLVDTIVIGKLCGLSSQDNWFLDGLMQSPALRCVSNLDMTLERVFSSALFSDDDIVLDFIFSSYCGNGNIKRSKFTLRDWQPNDNFLPQAVKKFVAFCVGRSCNAMPLSTIILPGSRVPNYEYQRLYDAFIASVCEKESACFTFQQTSCRKSTKMFIYCTYHNAIVTEFNCQYSKAPNKLELSITIIECCSPTLSSYAIDRSEYPNQIVVKCNNPHKCKQTTQV